MGAALPLGISSEAATSSGSTLRPSPKHVSAQRPLSLPPKPQIKFLRKTKSLNTPNGPKQGNFILTHRMCRDTYILCIQWHR